MERLIIIGAGGHGRVLADIAHKSGAYREVAFLDDRATEVRGGFPVLGKTDDFPSYLDRADFMVGIGQNEVRERVMTRLTEAGAHLTRLIHPSAVIGERAVIGEGTAVMAGAVIGVDAVIGRGVILNSCALADHDCRVDDFAHVAVGAHLAGTVHIGKATFVGAGVTVKNNIDICGGCTIGAGAVVVKHIGEAGVYIGVPCRKIP